MNSDSTEPELIIIFIDGGTTIPRIPDFPSIIESINLEPKAKQRRKVLTYHENLRRFLRWGKRYDYPWCPWGPYQKYPQVKTIGNLSSERIITTEIKRKTVKSLTPIRRYKQRKRK